MARDAVFWFDRRAPPGPPLRGAAEAEVVVVGGGMMGLMCARVLRRKRRDVCVVEAGVCGGGASGRSSGFITPDSELEFADLVARFGDADARRLWDFSSGGGAAIRAAIRDHSIECDLQDHGALFVASTRGAAETTRKEHDERARLGLESTYYEAARLPEVLGSESYHGGVRFGGTFGIDGTRACAGLRDALRASGVQVYENSPVTRIDSSGVETPAGNIRADAVVVCADRFLPSLGLARAEVHHVQTFLAITRPLGDAAVRRMFPAGPLMVWDTALAYRYFRIAAGGRLLIGGGTVATTYSRNEIHRPAAVARRLSRYLGSRFPGLAVEFDACWPGLIGITKDFAPVVGRHPEHPAVHFAGGAAGLPWAAALGQYLAERVTDGRRDLDGILAPSREFPVGPRVQAVIGKRLAFAAAHARLKFA